LENHKEKTNRLRLADTVIDYQFPLSRNAFYLDYSRQLADSERVQQLLGGLASSQGKKNDLCNPKPLIF